jgi:arylsulfatase A-like enzyme/thioredoxin-like negative regulator of GroEL
MTRTLSLLLAVSLLFATACKRSSEAVVRNDTPVIIISIDTLRADRLPVYGYRGVETPAIDALRRDSILYRNAWSHVPMTLPSHVSLLTGLLPPQHGVRNNLGYVFDGSKHPSLPKLLSQSGYATGAGISAYVLRASTGLGAEFDSYDDAISAQADTAIGSLARSGDVTVASAEKWIGANGTKPFFYLLHLFEPHTPYAPPEPFRTRYAANPYDGEIAAADAVVGRFLEGLKKSGIYDRALIVLLSDHGEGLGDHGEAEHGVFLYREALQVPLLLKLPKSERAGTTVDANVQLIDLYPTIAALTGAKAPEGLEGKSLLGELDPKRPAYAETLLPRLHFGWSDLQSIVSGSHHYIQAPRPELYDLSSDPRETKNVLTENRRVYAALREEAARHTAEAAAPSAVSKEEAEKLAALGYIGSIRAETAGDLPDPKDHIGDLEQMRLASRAEERGDAAEAKRIYEAVLARNPRFTDAWIRMAGMYESSGQPERAEEAYKRAIATAPSLAAGFALSLGNLQLRMRKLDDAAAHAQLALTKSSAAGGAHLLLARIALARGNAADAEREARLAAEESGRRREATLLIAELRVAQGRLPEALQLADQLRDEPGAAPLLDLESTRGDALARMSRNGEAENAFRAEIAAFPRNREAYTRLAVLYVTMNRLEDAERALQQMFEANRSRSTAELAAGTWAAVENAPAAARWRQRAAAMR